MPRQELHSDQLPPVQQMPDITDPDSYDGDIVLVDPEVTKKLRKDYLDELAFMEEPIQIRLEPSSDKNAADRFPIWCNGKRAEVFQNGRWEEIGYLPVGMTLTVKRKVVEIIVRTKVDTVHTKIQEMDSDRPHNVIQRFTSPVHSFSIIEDRNPRGAMWIQELRRRSY